MWDENLTPSWPTDEEELENTIIRELESFHRGITYLDESNEKVKEVFADDMILPAEELFGSSNNLVYIPFKRPNQKREYNKESFRFEDFIEKIEKDGAEQKYFHGDEMYFEWQSFKIFHVMATSDAYLGEMYHAEGYIVPEKDFDIIMTLELNEMNDDDVLNDYRKGVYTIDELKELRNFL